MKTQKAGRKPKQKGEKFQPITIKLHPALISELRAWVDEDKDNRSQGGLIGELLKKFFSKQGVSHANHDK